MTFLILLQALFATSFPLAKFLLGFVPNLPFFLSGIRMVISGLILLFLQSFVKTRSWCFKKNHVLLFLQIIILGFFMTYGLRLYALQVLPVWKTSFFYNLAPFLSALYAYILFGEKLSKKQWVGLFVGFLGMLPIVISSSPAEAEAGEFFYISRYELALMLSVLFHSYSWILIQKLVRNEKYHPAIVNGITMFSGGVLSLLVSYFFEGSVSISDPHMFTTGLMATIFIGNIVCHNLYATLLKTYSATFMSFTSFLSPLFAALYGWAFFQEKISWHFYVAAVVVFLGLYIFYQDELRKQTMIEIK
jgi:drug/metabolite transporter (DMT)-like permease